MNLPPEWSEDDLMTNFGPFGHIISATVSRDKATGLSKCFGAFPTSLSCLANVCNRLRQL